MMSAVSTWQLQDAKNRFSEVVRRSLSGPQTITVRGEPTAVVVSMAEYRALTQPRLSLLDVLRRAPQPLADLVEPRDGDATMREVGL
ncbi:MAG: type II toxin-antitoxin system Phd/YefM family antitoxin [Micrococcales bacterium]|nr:type II toxin-antitoxin system Phd/YefM family antitoxin [Micrococcales bacterium]